MMRKIYMIIFLVSVYAITESRAQTVTLDYYFNHEVKTDKNGVQQRYHYIWEDNNDSGFALWGSIFKKNGATLSSLEAAPTGNNLKGTGIYIIVDPDNAKESPQPNYMTGKDAEQIARWVKGGGVLVLMANDSANVELPHFNTLAAKFGLHFNSDLQNHVINDAHFNDGQAMITDGAIFKTARKVFLKDVCSISAGKSAKTALQNAGGTVAIAVTVKYGKGIVFAVGDPWLYNEYVNGRLPADFENDKAADDLAKWLLAQVGKK
jgi:hypothetical protein